MAKAKKQRKRTRPSVLVECDLVLLDEETEEPWLDRTGQAVRYRGGRKWKTTREMDDFNKGKAELADVEHLLCKLIVWWDWDDDFGDPIPHPPTPEMLGELEEEEVIWLMEHVPGIEKEHPKSDSASPSAT